MMMLLIVNHVDGVNKTVVVNRLNTRSYHKMNFGWKINSFIGVVGTVLNSIVFYLFILERNTFLTTVNVMIL